MPLFRANTVDFYYERHGEGEALLFLHGLGSSTRDWEYQLPFFKKNFTVYLIDMRGHGRSSKPETDYSFDLFTKDTCSFIRDIIQAPVHIIGLSLGAMVACSVATHPSVSLKSLTLVNCPGHLTISSMHNRIQYEIRLLLIRLFGMTAMGRFLAPRLFPQPRQKDLRKMFVQRWKDNNKNAYIRTMQAMIGWDIFSKTSQIRCPVNIIAADHDYFSLTEKRQYLAQLSMGKLQVIPHTHHALPVEDAATFNATLLEMLQTLNKES